MKNVKMYRNRRENRRKRSGFTLLELMIVMFILLLLAGLSISFFGGMQEDAKKKTTLTYVKLLESAVDQYYMTVGRCPPNLDALINPPQDLPDPGKWAGPYILDSASDTDPWGNQYMYEIGTQRSRKGYAIWSLGPDGSDGTDDDICSWKVIKN